MRKRSITLLILIFLLASLIPLTPAHANVPISNLYVWLHGTNAGENGTYYISFTNGDTAIRSVNHDVITIEFPEGTIFAKQDRDIALGDIKINNKALTAADVSLDSATRTLTIHDQIDIAVNTYILIEVTRNAGIYNPVTTGNKELTFTITTGTGDTSTYRSNAYNITGTPITKPNWSITNTGTGKRSEHTIKFQGSVVETDRIYIELPAQFTYTSSTNLASSIQINGKSVQKASISTHLVGTNRASQLLELTVPNGISTFTNKDVTVTISTNSTITNPVTEGDYPIKVYTSRDVVPQTSDTVAIRHQVSNTSLQVAPTTVREAAEYRIQFKPTGAIPATTGYIEVLFPSDTSVPSQISNGHVLINNSLSRMVERDRNNARLIRIYLPDNLALDAGKDVTVLIGARTGIQNPSTNGNYAIQVRTSADQSYANSSTYATTGGYTAPTQPTPPGSTSPGTTPGQGTSLGLTLSSKAPGGVSKYDIIYRTSTTGILKGGEDEITVLFIDGVQLPAFIDREHIRVNSVALDTGLVSVKDNRITFRLPSRVNIAGNSSFTITIDEKANIRHPQTEGHYSLFVFTPRDTVAAYSYEVQGLAAYGLLVNPIYGAQQQITAYNMTFKTHAAGALWGGTDWIELTLPRVVSQTQLQSDIQLYLNGSAIDNSKIQISGRTLAFFVPTGVYIAADKEVTLLLADPNRVLSQLVGTTVTYKLKTSRDTTEVESNPVTIVASGANTPSPPSSGTPTTPTPGPAVPNVPAPSTGGTTGTNAVIKLYLNRKETYINNQRTTDLLAAPYVHPQKDGVTMVPIRFISEALGANVVYKPEGKKITITYYDQQIVMTVGSDIVLKQGGGERLPVPVEAKADGITFIPVRFISEWMGFKVEYSSIDKSIILQK